jgi:hypothetical protein
VAKAAEHDQRLFWRNAEELAPANTSPIHLEEKPADGRTVVNPHPGNYIFLIGDASALGLTNVLAVGPNWWSMNRNC